MMINTVLSHKEDALLEKVNGWAQINVKTFSATGGFAPLFWLFGLTEAMEVVFGMMFFMFIVGVGLATLHLTLAIRQELRLERFIAKSREQASLLKRVSKQMTKRESKQMTKLEDNLEIGMSQKVRFESFSSEDVEMIVSSDPRQPSSLMIMMRDKYLKNSGLVMVLSPSEIDELTETLKDKSYLRIYPSGGRTGLSVRMSNRGEPYRSGLEVSLVAASPDNDEYDDASINLFFEEGYDLDALAGFVTDHLATLKDDLSQVEPKL